MLHFTPIFFGPGPGAGGGGAAGGAEDDMLAALLSALASSAVAPMRVRAVLEHSSVRKQTLKECLPAGVVAALPAVDTAPYPSALLSLCAAVPSVGGKGGAYAWLGIVAEELLRRPAAEIRAGALSGILMRMNPRTPHASLVKLFKSATTQPFLDCVKETREQVEAVASGPLRFEEVVRSASGAVEGHPDARTDTQIFEVKLTGQLKENWQSFLFQLFAYGALAPEVEELFLVLPLQKSVVRFDVRGWSGRAAYAAELERAAAGQGAGFSSRSMAAALCDAHLIGCHMPKRKSLRETILSLGDFRKPYQIFLGPPQSSKLSISDADLAGGAATIAETGARVYVHSPYMINLATDASAEGADSAWNTELLRKNLRYGAAIGCRGVVVHVGKSVKRATTAALETMRANILACLEDATPACPLLLETPAGQGTELLTDADAFIGFVQEIADPRLKICVDTCHTFACGQDPLTYIKKVPAEKLALIHFNDSKEACGSRKDRHAFIGEGHIGYEKMEAIAHHCSGCSVPMVIE